MTGQDDGFMAGQVQGLVGLVLALDGTHSEPQLLLQHLDTVEDMALAAVEPTAMSDEFVAGIRDTIGRARGVLQKRLAVVKAGERERHSFGSTHTTTSVGIAARWQD